MILQTLHIPEYSALSVDIKLFQQYFSPTVKFLSNFPDAAEEIKLLSLFFSYCQF